MSSDWLLDEVLVQLRSREWGGPLLRSVKIRADAVLTRRYLIHLDLAGSAPVEAASEIQLLAVALGASEYERAQLGKLARSATTVYLGCEQLDEDRGRVKVYLGREAAPGEGVDRQTLIQRHVRYRAVAWEHGTSHLPTDGSVTDYVEVRGQSLASHVDRALAMLSAAAPSSLQRLITSEMIYSYFGVATEPMIFYLEVNSGRRRSFDVNVTAARHLVGDLRRALVEIAATMGQDASLHAALDDLRDSRLCRLAAGADAQGRDFVTLYLAPERSTW